MTSQPRGGPFQYTTWADFHRMTRPHCHGWHRKPTPRQVSVNTDEPAPRHRIRHQQITKPQYHHSHIHTLKPHLKARSWTEHWGTDTFGGTVPLPLHVTKYMHDSPERPPSLLHVFCSLGKNLAKPNPESPAHQVNKKVIKKTAYAKLS